ncbi:MAG: polysaccharide biosynthesis protein [Anaerolineae bacterium]|nr:polysaccharide biosynthesis protein [Anaerolineae bacterium]
MTNLEGKQTMRIFGLKPGITTRNRKLGQWLLIDYGLVVVAYTLAFYTRAITADINYRQSLSAILVSGLMLVLMAYMFGIYRRIWSQTSGHGITLILNAVAVSTVVLLVGDALIDPRPLPLSVILVGSVFSIVGMVAVRYRSRLVSGMSWRWRAVWKREFPQVNTRVLIIGAGESGQDLAWRLKHRFPDNNYHIVGFIDDDPEKQQMYVEGCRVLGGRFEIARIVEAHSVDLIVLALHNITGKDFREVVELCESTHARIKVIPDVFELVRNQQSDVPPLRDIQPEDLLGRSPVTRHQDVDLSPVMGKVILITGAAGSIGAELSHQIMDYEPVKIILLDNNESGLHDLSVELRAQYPKADLVPALVDISSLEPVRLVFKKHHPQIVFHAAAYKHVPMLEYYPQEALRVNVTGTLNLAEMALTYDVERFVLVSTDKAVKPSNIMGASKRVGELLLHAISKEEECRTLFTAVRFGNVLGSRGSVIPTFNRQIDSGGPVTVTHPDMTRYFMSIPEAVNLIIHAACMTVGDEIFVLKMGEEVRIVDLAERMVRLRGLRPYKDIAIEFTGIRPGEKLHEVLFYDDENPTDTLHPNIVKLNNWPEAFAPEQFFEQVVKLVTQNQDTTTMQVLTQLQTVIASRSQVPHSNGKVSQSVAMS